MIKRNVAFDNSGSRLVGWQIKEAAILSSKRIYEYFRPAAVIQKTTICQIRYFQLLLVVCK